MKLQPIARSQWSVASSKRCAPDGLLTTDYGPRTSRAFTMIEIMIAIGIFALVLAAIFSSWTAILRASKAGLDAAASVQRARIAIRTIEESLGSAECFAAHMQQHPEYYAFVYESGNEGSLSFVARLAKSFPRSGRFGDLDVRRLTFSVEQGSEGSRQLVLRQSPILTEMDVDEREHPLVLAKNVREFQLQFWDQKTSDWTDEWKDNLTNQLPGVVMVTLKLTDKPHSVGPLEEITRIISLPSVSVQPGWQRPVGGLIPGQIPPGQTPPAGGAQGGQGQTPPIQFQPPKQ